MEEELFVGDYVMVFQKIYQILSEGRRYNKNRIKLKEKIYECDKVLCRHFNGFEIFGLKPSEQHLQRIDNLIENINILEKK
ncbi:MAG: hypothetical protein ACOC1P_03990 [Minisyncoccales bacterium]